ncbi:NnrS family protein [Saccharospirillum impatiens]|uniref:NnrS family protein n=1 Tax=Saccharospirillum impatiens TaxID=169438 RepID=UPI0003F59CFB|nr:NnrS family protein [Saccharospirillum impatiens]
MPQLSGTAWLSYSFRPFFLATALYAILAVLFWVAYLFGGWSLPIGWSPMHWHSHEMLYGWVPAAIAGFLLTAMTNWTGARPLSGAGLLALLMLWVAGRVMFLTASLWPAWLVALVDLSFLAVLTIYVAVVLIDHKNYRNLMLAGVLALLLTGNAVMHLGFNAGSIALLKSGEQLGLGLITLMMAIIAGRIIPAFTGNWLRLSGKTNSVRRPVWLDRLAIGSIALLIPLSLLPVGSRATGLVALLAGLTNGLRLVQWQGWRTLGEPLLWILHLAYAWLALSLVFRGLTDWSLLSATHFWQHSLGLGAMATLILGVMTRVALGHTGRPLKLPRGAVWVYWLITLATLLRLAASAQWLDYRWAVNLSALAWILAFGLFLACYTRILTSPRTDA